MEDTIETLKVLFAPISITIDMVRGWLKTEGTVKAYYRSSSQYQSHSAELPA